MSANTDARSLLEIAQQYATPGLVIHARLEGLPPGLLMHSAAAMEKQAAADAEHRASGKRTKFIPSREQEAEWGAYMLPSGDVYLPATNILRSCIEASKAFKMPKSRASMRKEAAAGIGVPISVGLGFPLLKKGTDDLIGSDYTIDTQRAVVQRNAIMRSRPLVAEWAVDAEFTLDPEAVPPEIFAQILGYAGSRIGLCDLRPEKGGSFGRFVVASLEVA